MAQIPNAFSLNHIIQTRNRRTGKLEYVLTVHKGHHTGSIELMEEQFKKLETELVLAAESSLTHEDNKVYIIQ